MSFTPGLRTLLIALAVVSAILPVIAAISLKIYEYELVKRTEGELITQGAVYARAFELGVLKAYKEQDQPKDNGSESLDYGRKISGRSFASKPHPESGITPIFPSLNAYDDPVLPPPPDGKSVESAPDQYAAVAASQVLPLMEAARRVTLAGIRVLDYKGRVVASTGAEMGMDLSDRYEIKRALAGHYTSVMRVRGFGYPRPPLESISRRTGYRVYVALPVIHGDKVIGAVSLARTPMDTMKALYLRKDELVGAGAIIAVLVLGISLLLSYLISRPIHNLTARAKRVAEGAFNTPEESIGPTTKEAESLSRAFGAMAESLEERANYFRAFAYNVSHEFKTPLTSMTASVELLEDHISTMSEQERSRFLFMLKGDLQRLERLMNKLLDLARADTARPGDDQIDVVPALSDIVERFRERGLKIEHTCSEGAILAPISEEALGAIIGNLLENSVQHGGPDVTVSLVVRRIRSDEAPLVRIELGDNGPGAPEKHRDNIFERFFTTNREAGGTGLGLSIVKTIVEAHGGDIELAPSVKGALFIITLPSARRAHGQ